MIRRLALILLLTLPFGIKAQQMTGSWELFSVFNSVDKALETPDRVYYLSSGNLYAFDYANNESITYNTYSGLNDSGITDMYYNRAGKYLLLTYSNGNIDMIYDNGDIVNMSDIKDAIMTEEKVINHVAFNKDKIFVATNFGVVIFDGVKHYVLESGMYKKNIYVFAQVGDYYIISDDNNLYYLPASRKINMLSNFTQLVQSNGSNTHFYYRDIQVVSDNKILAANTGMSVEMRLYTFDFENGIGDIAPVSSTQLSVNDLNCWKDGYYISDGNTILTVDLNGENAQVTTVPTALRGGKVAFWEKADLIFACDSQGVGRYNIEGGNVTVLNDKYIPENLSVPSIDGMIADNFGNIYLYLMAASLNYGTADAAISAINVITPDGEIKNITPTDFTYYTSYLKNNYSGSFRSIMSVYPHPTIEGTYFCGNFFEGIMMFENFVNHKLTYNWNNSNMPYAENWCCIGESVDFDKEGNMWVMYGSLDETLPRLTRLSAANVGNNEVTAEDWKGVSCPEFGLSTHDGKILCLKNSSANMIIAIDSKTGDYPVLFYDIDADEYTTITTFTDQDGKQFSSFSKNCMMETSDGKVWMGTDDGIYEMTNPANVANGGRVNRIKVPRNDGTNLADYLLASQYVTSMTEDSSGRKWITTRDSGIYLVSADGSEIIQNFTTDNSPLTSNNVHCVKCSPNSNAVYFGGEGVLYKYNSTSSPAQSDYSNVLAYPNPVRPDYTGWITITGLMENSLVKIADSAGNVVYQTTSEGGMAVWNGCNLSGERVRTGVYYVFASQSGEGVSGNSAVTKIMIVR